MGSFSRFAILSALLIIALSYASAAFNGTFDTVDANYYTADANVNIRGVSFDPDDLGDMNIVFVIVDANRTLNVTTDDINYWGGRDLNILDNNADGNNVTAGSAQLCDENVFAPGDLNAQNDSNNFAVKGDLNSDLNGVSYKASGKFAGYYVQARRAISATCIGNPAVSFDVNFVLPKWIKPGFKFVYAYRLKKIQSSGLVDTNYTGNYLTDINYDAGRIQMNTPIYITPYITVLRQDSGGRVSGLLRPFGSRSDNNVMLRGVGFPRDANVWIGWKQWTGAGYVRKDINMRADGNGSVYDWNTKADYNTGGTDQNKGIVARDNNGTLVHIDTNDTNGFVPETRGNTNWGFYRNGRNSVVRTGGFDVNIFVPADATIGGPYGDVIDVNYAYSGTSAANPGSGVIDINDAFMGGMDSNFHAFPTVTITETDQNVVVGITAGGLTTSGSAATCSTTTIAQYITISQAMRDGNISDMNSVCNLVISMADANIAMNSGVNMGQGPTRSYDSDMNGRQGQASIDTTDMPEFAIDANITLLNVRSPSGQMPVLARDGFRCPVQFCKNRDNTTPVSASSQDVYGQLTWVWNSVTRDGNIFFRVSTFSTYGTVTFDANIVSPNGGTTIYRKADGNILITFNFQDTNESRDRRRAALYYSDNNTTGYKLIVDDTNILDFLNNTGVDGNISCADSDLNLATIQVCSYSWDANVPAGVYWIDLNVMDWNYANYLIDSSDNNVIINTPKISVLSPAALINGSGTQGDGKSDTNLVFTIDLNMRYDFNLNNINTNRMSNMNKFTVFIDVDNNRNNGIDANLYDANRARFLVDLNLDANVTQPTFCNTRGNGGLDGNVGPGTDGNSSDMNCSFDVNMSVAQVGGRTGRVKGEYYVGVDTNNFGAVYTARTVFIEDRRPTATIYRPLDATSYITGTYRIDFNVNDADWYDYNKSDGNFLLADIYYDTDNNLFNGYGTLITNDLNLATRANCKQDTNLADQNSAVDANCSYSWDTSALADGNYNIVIDLNENKVGGTIATDANVSQFSFQVDNSAPTASITYPTIDGATVTSQIIMTYGGSDSQSGIKTFWVRLDSTGLYTNNGINTSYTFSSLACGRQYTLYLKSTNNSDLNSPEKSQTIGTSSCATGGTGPTTGGGGPGPTTPTTTPTEETVTTDTTPYAPTEDVISEILYNAFSVIAPADGIEAAIERAKAAEDLSNVIRDIQVVKSTSTTNVITYYTNISLKVENPGTKNLENVKVIEIIPKTVALSATEITSEFAFNILVDDPVVEFTVPLIATGATTTVTYKVQKQIDSNAIASYKAPVVADLQETEVSLCDGIDSDDSNPCTADSCDETTGTVSNVAVADGTECGTGKECSAGECVEIAPEAECTEDADCGTGESCVDGACEAAEAAAAGPDWTLIGGIVVLIIIIAGAAYYFLIMRRR